MATRFNMKVLVRPENEEDFKLKKETKLINVTAESEQKARREALERAWSLGYLVTEFLSVERRVV